MTTTTRLAVATIALVMLPALGAAQTDTGQAQRGGAGRRGGAGAQGGARGNMGLTSDQITQLQQSLSEMGCYRGRVDGLMGPRTRQGLSCARRQKNLQGNNANELFRSMNLDFTVEDSMGMGGVMRSGASGNAQRNRAQRDTSGSQPSDSARADRRQGGENRGRGNAAGNTPGRRGGRDSTARPPRQP